MRAQGADENALKAAIEALRGGESVGAPNAEESRQAVRRVAYADDLGEPASEAESELVLTDEQAKSSTEIKQSMRAGLFETRLLHGVTGSGKTEVYFEAMEEAYRALHV